MKMLFSLLVLIASQALADEWPYDPVCRRFSADSETVQIVGANHPPVVLCRFGLSSYIDKGSLPWAPGGVGGFEKMAVRAYKELDGEPFNRSCGFHGATLWRAVDSRGRSYTLCRFIDNSFIEEQTFSWGPESSFNSHLNDALGIPWLLDL